MITMQNISTATKWFKTTSKLTLFQSCGLVDFPTGSLVKSRYQLIERVKAVLANTTQTTT